MKTKRILSAGLTIAFVLFTFLNCSVSDGTGLIRIANRTKTNLTNVKIGTTVIASVVTPGSFAEYWYISDISGKLSSENIDVRTAQKNLTFTLKTGYWADITASITYSGNNELYIQASKIGGTLSPADWIK